MLSNSSDDLVFRHTPSGGPKRPKREAQWLQVLSHLSPKYGGIATSVPKLAKATEDASAHACPIAGFCELEELEQMQQQDRANTRVFPPSRLRWITNTSDHKLFKEAISTADGVHIHGLWETHSMTAAAIARSCKRPYIISAHGMLEPWALRSKRLKKALYGALIEMRRMRRAACLRALSVDEVNDYRRLGLTNPIAIIPNGTETHPEVGPDLFLSMFPELVGKRIILFLGRLHQKKGLHILLKAWAKIASDASDAHLVIAGPDSDNTLSSLEAMTDDLKLKCSVTFAGMLTGREKWSAYAAAGLFVLPSYSEGFSVSVLEALSMALPVLVTTQCHIPEVETHDCGWVIEPEVTAITQTLDDFLSLSPEEAQQIGRRGRKLVQTRFNSEVVGKQMAQVYDWLQGGNRPSAVDIV